MATESTGKIISLTYHEITQDPRVLKQARVLQKAGYDVHVFCDWQRGLPEFDDIDGVQITRFRCYHHSGVTTAALDKMDFLESSRDEVTKRYFPYAVACERLESFRPFLESKFGPGIINRAQSSYFKECTGSLRIRRLIAYLYYNLRLHFVRVPETSASSLAGEKSDDKNRRVDLRTFRALRRKLYQAESVAYSSNLPDILPGRDIVAVHAHDIYCLPAGVVLSQKLGVPLVYDAHEYEPARATKIDPTATRLPELLENDCFAHINRMITVSDGIAALYKQRFEGPAPTIVMNAPEVDADMTLAEVPVPAGLKTVREQVGLPEDVPLVVFTGGIQREHRGVDKVLEALVHLPGAHLALLGSRNVQNDKWLADMAKRLGVRDRVHMLPPVDARHVPAAISTATVSICPFQDVSLNHRLAMPNKLFEAAFARIPICVSNLPEMKRFVETLGIGKVMDQTDPKAIAAALQDIFDNRDRYLVGTDARQKLSEIYSWRAQSAKLLALYESLPRDGQASLE